MNDRQTGARPDLQRGGAGQQRPGGRFEAPALEKITAPYNFVPLSRKVFFPEWAEQVSHDVPFEDGISGELSCEIVTDTPVYVRNGGKWDHDQVMKDPDAQSFFYVNEGGRGHFIIPGTSLKGMLRNVVEIASFGKINRVDDHRYSVRDLQNSNLYGQYLTVDAGSRTYKPLSRSGWLVLDQTTETWKIIPCSFARVDHGLLANSCLLARQSARSKYGTWGETRLKVSFDCSEEIAHPHSGGKKLVYRKVTMLDGGGTPGTLVFTGQPALNDGRPGKKHMEFVFFNEGDKQIAVSETVQKEFQFIHSNANEQPNEEWGYWKNKLSKGARVPVFYLVDKNGSLTAMGLAMMFRLPYANSVKQAIRHTSPNHSSASCDLAETIFGFVDEKKPALKGRVSISPARATRAEQGDKVTMLLGGPKPTFYPNYIKQPSAGQYKTFMDKDCEIRGWKRYPARPLADVVKNPPSGGDQVDTRMIPLKEDALFEFRVKVHNLKPVELGAIAWALTWGGDERLRHGLGMGKSMGYGVARIRIVDANLTDMTGDLADWKGAMNAYAARMEQEVSGGWLQSQPMEQLVAMSNPALTPQCGKLSHLFLGPGPANDFVSAKRALRSLLPHVKPTGKPEVELPKEGRADGAAMLAASGAQPVPVAVLKVVETIVWEGVVLGYNPGSRTLNVPGPGGKKTEARLEGSKSGLISEDTLMKLKKGKIVMANVTLVKEGSLLDIQTVQPI
jgi:CRISPR-associated protein (TIGR03986 family)